MEPVYANAHINVTSAAENYFGVTGMAELKHILANIFHNETVEESGFLLYLLSQTSCETKACTLHTDTHLIQA